jgi:hypothetical protein
VATTVDPRVAFRPEKHNPIRMRHSRIRCFGMVDRHKVAILPDENWW